MKKLYSLASVFLIGNSVFAQSFENISQTSDGVSVKFELQKNFNEFQTIEINGVQHLDFSKSFKVLTSENGAPALPTFGKDIALPAKGNPTFSIVSSDYTDYQNISVAPSKGNLKRNVSPSQVSFVFGAVYQSNENYPTNAGELGSPFVWRALRGSTLRISPIQYNPVTKVLRVYHSLILNVSYNETQTGENEINEWIDPVMSKYQKTVVINPSVEKYSALEEEGEMLIIAADDLVEAITPFANWKNQKGIKTTVVPTSVAGNTAATIKTYVTNAYNTNNNLLYLVLVGDHEQVPAHTYGVSFGENLYSDSYYGQISGGTNDYRPELFVGRISGNSAQVSVQVNRILQYEKTPSAGNWMEKALGIGSDEGAGYGDDGEADWQHLRNIRTVLMNSGYTSVAEFYDGTRGGEDAEGNPNPTVILPVVNEGVGLFNYTGHGDLTTCVTGNFSSSNVNSATNEGKFPFVVSVACNNGTFTGGTCISETWLRAGTSTNPKGGIAACGSSILMAWAPPMETQDEMAELIAGNVPSNKKETLGGLFYNSQMSMLEQYNDESGREVVQTWVMFGDPSTLFRSKQTQNLTASHVSNVPQTVTTVNVNCNVEGALVAISQSNVLLGKAIVSGGLATITFPTLSTDMPLAVTATKQNYGVYQGSIQVGNGPLSLEDVTTSFEVYPNPSSGQVNLQMDAEQAQVMIFSTSGILVKSQEWTNGQSISIEDLPSGMYMLAVKTSSGEFRKMIEVLK